MPKKPQHKKKPIKSSTDDLESVKTGEVDDLVQHEEKKYKNRDIQSNWEKYKLDSPEVNTEDEKTSANDFNSLLKSTHSVTSAFKFKFERNWEKELAAQQPFQLNINLQALSAGLSCIPFYERIGLSPNEFSEEDLQKCDAYAAKCLKKYESTKDTYFKLDKTESSDKIVEENIKSFISRNKHMNALQSSTLESENKNIVGNKECSSEPILTFENVEKISDHFKDISIDDELTNSHKTSNVSEQKVVKDDEDLEDWLDSVLDS